MKTSQTHQRHFLSANTSFTHISIVDVVTACYTWAHGRLSISVYYIRLGSIGGEIKRIWGSCTEILEVLNLEKQQPSSIRIWSIPSQEHEEIEAMSLGGCGHVVAVSSALMAVVVCGGDLGNIGDKVLPITRIDVIVSVILLYVR